MDLGLNGKTAVVTGASRGIGLAIAETLAAEGVRVVGGARTITPELEKVAAAAVSVDLSGSGGARTLIDAALEELGGIDILINNVGGGDTELLGFAGVLETPEEQWRDLFDLNLFGVVAATRAALPSLIERQGAIVNVSSINAHAPSTGPVGYSEAKAALKSFGKRLSEELGPKGVRVNTVSPGVTGTDIWRGEAGLGAKLASMSGVAHEDFLAAVPGQFGIASGRISEAAEVAALVAFVASARAGNIVGADFVIDGGTLKTA
ncbi:SDR family NAD(P)-dependent oxidoreductase [Nocardia huaxiensis]|uniref:3-oxoacyl-[acyl-carrier-protein] reductase MabA n=1 Tax=Nocardia huaxiensis TaxID=2755382 RepID=A0A7D6VG00_9NOCA|nr:SDR family NAD(P)-dependent oxidoreductase [Nocardia huaxiensis]QLY32077.1 SDR family oxidoreductase [Nocardia huaxiensis]UFS95656.1 SDR family oxidoreductase [Nocardia huaxiensis]